MKKLIALLTAVVLALSLCACGGGSSGSSAATSSETAKASDIEVKGTFLLEPSEDLNLSADGLASVQRYFLVVYDVSNSGSENRELSTHSDSVTVTLNDTNTYEQLYKTDGAALQSFRANCGYTVSANYGTLWGGSEPVRMIAAFAINGNDVKDDCSATIKFSLADNLKTTCDVTKADIQTIHWFDEVFAVEDDPDAYQLSRSVKNRAQLCKTALETSSQANQLGQTDVRDTQLALCEVLFSEDATWGISCCSGVISEELPTFNVESVRKYNPEIADKTVAISDSIRTMNTELAASAPNYDNINTAQRLAYNTLNEILAAFEA